jgi:hypothetical protein
MLVPICSHGRHFLGAGGLEGPDPSKVSTECSAIKGAHHKVVWFMSQEHFSEKIGTFGLVVQHLLDHKAGSSDLLREGHLFCTLFWR